MNRDDWKYDEEMGDEEAEEAAPAREKQCLHCLHAVPSDAPYCPWCGKQFPEPRKPLAPKD